MRPTEAYVRFAAHQDDEGELRSTKELYSHVDSTLDLCQAIQFLEGEVERMKERVGLLAERPYEDFLDGMRKLLGVLP